MPVTRTNFFYGHGKIALHSAKYLKSIGSGKRASLKTTKFARGDMGSIPEILWMIKENLFRKGRGFHRQSIGKRSNQNSNGFALPPDDLVLRDEATARVREIAAAAARQLRVRGEPVPLHTLSAIHFGLKPSARSEAVRGTMLKSLQHMCHAAAFLILAVGIIRLTERHTEQIQYDRLSQQLLALQGQAKAIKQQTETWKTDLAGTERGLRANQKRLYQGLQDELAQEHATIALHQPSSWSSNQVMRTSTKQTKWGTETQWQSPARAKPRHSPCMLVQSP